VTEQSLSTICLDPPWPLDPDGSAVRVAGRAYCAGWIAAVLGGERARKPRKPTLTRVLKQAAKAGKSVKGAEVYQDRVVLQFGKPESAESEEWPLDELRTKETKQ